MHGVSEHSARHLNTVNWLIDHGFEVVRFDFRGSGRSGGRSQWVEKFSDYVEDAISVFSWIQRNLDRTRLFVLGHSMGGAVAIHFASHYGNQFDGLILSAPAFQTGSNIPPWKISIGKVLVKFVPTLRIHTVGDHSALSRDAKVCRDYGEDPLSFHYNTLQQGEQILLALEKVPEACKKISIPTIVVHGTADKVIRPQGSFIVLQSLASRDKELHFVPGGYHEPHNDIIRQEYFALVTRWLQRQLSAAKTSQVPLREDFQGMSSMRSS